MSIHQRAHSLVRTIILFSSVLAIVGVLFAVVQYLDLRSAPLQKNASTSGTETQPVVPVPRTQPMEEASWLSIKPDAPAIGTGKKSRIRKYAPGSDVAQMEILVTEWKPIPNRDDEFEVIEPEIRGRTPSGQDLRVIAEHGVLRMKKSESGANDPQYGRLDGHVRIEWDLLKEEDRKKLSPEEQNAPAPPERMVIAELDDVEFDFESARMRCAGTFLVKSERADIMGEGLTVRYNQLTGRLVRLSVEKGHWIRLRKLGRSLKIALPGESMLVPDAESQDDELVVANRDVADEKEAEPEEVILNPGDEKIPWLVPKESRKKKKAKPIETYHAVFSGKVKVVQGKQSGISADSLDFVFDLGQKQRNRNWTKIGSGPASNGAVTTSPVADTQTNGEAGSNEPEVELTWNGPFMIEFVDTRPMDVEVERLHVKAVGNPVRVWDGDRSASCGTLDYKDETKTIRLRAGEAGLVDVRADKNGQMTGQELFFDQLKGDVRIAGPGVLTDAKQAQALVMGSTAGSGNGDETVIQFSEELSAHLAYVEKDVEDTTTGKTIHKRQEYIDSAHFLGDVFVKQGDSSIQGDEVDVSFTGPGGTNAVSGRIKKMYARGDVMLKHGSREIECSDHLEVWTNKDERNLVSLSSAEAVGNVVASEGDQKITAGERMVVDLRQYEKAKPPFDLTKARAMVIREGGDPDTIDWEQKQREYEAEPRYEPGVRRLRATGGVTIREPGRNLNVDCQSLDCTFLDGRNIDKAFIVGPDDGAAASVEFGAYSVLGNRIDLDVMNEKAIVPGKGRLTFTSVKDLDGRDLDEPRSIAVTWTKEMEFRGDRNVAVFDGMVHASSADSSFDCQKMVISFADVESESVVEPEEPSKPFWVFGRFLPGSENDEESDDVTPVRKFNKEPIFMTATGNVVALVANNDNDTGRLRGRLCIKAPAMDIDIKHQLMSIEHAGTLLVEDYRQEAPKDKRAKQDRSPFGGLVGGSSSQTYLKWADTMSYNFRDHTASFNKDVELRHRSGENLLLASGPPVGVEETMEKKGGRNALLQCNSLLVQFLAKKREGRGARSGLGRMSGFDLDKFNADENVYFEDSGVSAFANRVTFDREQELLSILGTEEVPAEVYDQRDAYRHITGPRIYWYRTSDRIEAPDAIIRQR